MGRSAYWKGLADSLASFALGDANRGAFLALQSAVSTRRRLVATDPPERRAAPRLGGGRGGGVLCVGVPGDAGSSPPARGPVPRKAPGGWVAPAAGACASA